MRRIIPNKPLYLFCWFTAAMVLCLYSSRLNAAMIIPGAGTMSEISPESISLELTSVPSNTFVVGLLNNDIFSDTHNLLNEESLNADKQITCYPNPATSYINFKFEKSVKSNYKILIYSFTGRKMDELSIKGSITKLPLDDYYRGLYVYQLRDERGAVLESGKFQVKK